MSLYLKYRPANFEGLVGQDALKSILLHQLKTKQVFHNYLFCGGRGTGKTSTARLLAKAVNCSVFDAQGFPDFAHDPIIQQIDDGRMIDIIEIDAASHTGVDNIREEIIEKSSYPPVQLRKKVYIIDEVHMLSKGAFNALLKIMEEPPCYPGTQEAYVMFILATTELHKVPETIVSRCQVFNFKQLTPDQVVGQLQMIAEKESIPTTHEGLHMIAKISGGAMRDAIKYLEQVSMLGEISPENVSQFLGIASDDTIRRIIEVLMTSEHLGLIELLEPLSLGGTDMTQLIKDCMTYCDENFSKNPSGYAMLARQLKDLFQNVKWYPNALLAWKVTFSGVQNLEIRDQNVKRAEKKETEIQQVVQKQAEKEQDSQQINQISDLQPLNTSSDILINNDQLLESLINACEKMMIKSSLKNYTMIDRIHDGVIEAVIINEQFYSLMNKTDIISYLEGLIQQCGYGSLKLRLSYMPKEDYIMKSMMA